KELIKEIKERIGSLDVRDNIERRAYEIALASLEAEPIAMVVPDEMDLLTCHLDGVTKTYADGWNACRVAMLQAGNFRENKNSSTNNFREISETSTRSPITLDGWISCSERMPPQDDWILIYSKHGEYMAGQVQGEYVELSDGTLSWLGNALFWMPLPEPPQEAK
ncbi:DUF551 domain-containing protein, partial [Escherichia coli]|nr:DUF551 domain-containing protein [Escherichia coli]